MTSGWANPAAVPALARPSRTTEVPGLGVRAQFEPRADPVVGVVHPAEQQHQARMTSTTDQALSVNSLTNSMIVVAVVSTATTPLMTARIS